MTAHDALLPATVLQRKAVVYVRQSTPQQVQSNLESQRRQYGLVDVARRRGFTNVEIIDDDLGRSASGAVDRPGFDRLVAALCAGQVGAVLCLDADDLSAAWKAPRTTMRTRQRLVRALITEIVADVDEAAGEIVLVIHWKGGQHSELRVRKPRTGEHGCSTPEQALAVMRSMAGRWSDQDIAASLNRMGMPTGQSKTWTAKRVSSLRRVHGIHGYRSADKDGEWLTMRDAAAKLGVSHHQIRKLIEAGVLVSEQIMPDAPHQIRSADLASEQIGAALKRKVARVGPIPKNRSQCFRILEEKVQNESVIASSRTRTSASALRAFASAAESAWRCAKMSATSAFVIGLSLGLVL